MKILAKKKVVLVVDNDDDIQEVMVDALAHAGFDSLGARSARQALSFLDDVDPAVIVLDFLLSDMNGVELARAIRSRPSGELIPLLVVTGAAGVARERLAKANLDIQVLAKPVTVVMLADTIEHLCEVP